MASASHSRSLRGIFIKRQSTKFKAVVAAKPDGESKRPSSSVEAETRLREVVNEFKKSCERKTFRNDRANYAQTISRLAAAKKFSMIEDVLEHQKNYVDIRAEGFATRLISLYGKAGMFGHARKLFDELPQLNCHRGIMSINALLKAGIDSNDFDAVVRAFKDLPLEVSIEPNVISYNTVVHALCKRGDFEGAVLMLSEMERNGKEPNLVTFNTVLNALYRDGRVSEGERVFASMVTKNVVPDVISYNAKLLGVFSKNGDSSASEVVSEMESRGIKPNLFTYNALIKGYCGRGDLKESMKWYNELLMSGEFTPNVLIYTVLIPACCKEGDHDTAFEVCVQAIHQRLFLKSALLMQVVDGLATEGKTEMASKLVESANSADYLNYKLKSPGVV